MHECFHKKKLISDKQLYNKEIRPDVNDRKKLKKELSRHESGYQYLIRKLKKVDKSIDSKIADYNSQAIRQKIGRHGTISKQDFWKLKKKLAPRNVEVPSSLTYATGDQIIDSMNIRREYHREFQHRLRTREIKSGLEGYERLQNKLCMVRLKVASKVKTPDFSINEVKHAVNELKTGKCSDSTGLIREGFKNVGDALLHSICDMANSIKRSKAIPLEWSKIWIKTLKRKKGSFKN